MNTVKDRLIAAGAIVVPPLVPFNTTTGDALFDWVGKGKPAPAVEITFVVDTELAPFKISGFYCVSETLMREQTTHAAQQFLRAVRDKHAPTIDRKLMDPTIAAVADVNPASLTYGLTPVNSSGTSAIDMEMDARTLLGRFDANGGRLERAVVVLSPANAIALRLSGHDAFRGLTREGGDYAGFQRFAPPRRGP